jgi:hypothetical protein
MSFGIESPTTVRDISTMTLWLSRLWNHLRFFTGVKTVTAAYEVEDHIFYLRANASGGAFAVKLPAAVKYIGRTIFIKKVDNSANAVTVTPNGSDTIEGSATLSLAAQWDEAHLIAGASGSWEIIN